MKVIMRFRYFYCIIALCIGVQCCSQKIEVPPYYKSHLQNKIAEINHNDTTRAAFVFITDTHTKDNTLHSPALIREILRQTRIDKVIWGGDAISGHGDNIDEQWNNHSIFDIAINSFGRLYKVRGNHDFSIKVKKGSDIGKTYSQTQTAKWLLEHHPKGITINKQDPGGCYYYFDEKKEKIRYIILDATDSVQAGDIPWGAITGIRSKQLNWIANTAIASIQFGYDVIFVSHIPLVGLSGKPNSALSNATQLIDALNLKKSGVIDGVAFDFSKLKNVKILMCLSGHVHYDSQIYRNGVLYVTTASDAAYNNYFISDPFVKSESERKEGTVNEQCFDCFVISKSNSIINAHRIGAGGDRMFHCQPILMTKGSELHLRTIMSKQNKFSCYNATGNTSKKKKWTLVSDIVQISENGNLIACKKGEAVVVSVDEEGNKEFFDIIVK